jgi:hypothetical protein
VTLAYLALPFPPRFLDYPFHLFPPSTLLIDVGGGIGFLPELLLPTQSHLNFVVKDLEPVIKLANEVASPNMQNWIKAGKVRFLTHDCFQPRPETFQGAVFILKNMMSASFLGIPMFPELTPDLDSHNYPDSQAVQILAAICSSNAAKILVFDRMVVPELRTEVGDASSMDENHVPSSSQMVPTMYDLVMAALHGGRARTVEEWRSLFTKGGTEFRCDNTMYIQGEHKDSYNES